MGLADFPGAVEVVRTYADGAERRQVVTMLDPMTALVASHWPPPDGETHTGEAFFRAGNPVQVIGDVSIVRLKQPITGVAPVRVVAPQVGWSIFNVYGDQDTVRGVYPHWMHSRIRSVPGYSGSPIYARFAGEYVLCGMHWSTALCSATTDAVVDLLIGMGVDVVRWRHPLDVDGNGTLDVNDLIQLAQTQVTPEEAAAMQVLWQSAWD